MGRQRMKTTWGTLEQSPGICTGIRTQESSTRIQNCSKILSVFTFPQVDWIWVSWSSYQWRRKKAAHFNLSDRSFWAILSFFCLWLKEKQFFWSYCSRNAFHCWHGLLYCWTGIWHPKLHDRASSIGRFRVLVLYTWASFRVTACWHLWTA